MKKISAFCRCYLSFIVFAIWTVLFISTFMFWFKNVSTLSVCIVMGVIGFAVNILLAWLLAFKVCSYRDREMLKCWVFLASMFMGLFIYITTSLVGIVYIVIGWFLCLLISSIIIENVSETSIRLEELKKVDYKDYLRKKVKMRRFLDVAEELDLLDLPDAEDIVKLYIKRVHFFRSSEEKFLADRRFANLWEDYFKCCDLFEYEELKLFDRPDALEILEKYCNWSELSEKAELKLFTMPNAEDFVKMYIERGAFRSIEAELKLFELPHAEELVKFYGQRYVFYNDAYKLAKEKGWIQ